MVHGVERHDNNAIIPGMKVRCFFYLLLALWSCSFAAHAQVLVLVHGYLGSGGDWRLSGITHALDRAGWEDGGHLSIQESKVVNYRAGRAGQDKTFYTLDMPSEASILVQAEKLAIFMQAINKFHPGESLNIAGFSAGGVIGRTYMVMRKDEEPRVASLITIATPHLGSHLAELGVKLRQTPFSWVAPYLGAGSFNRSDVLFHDLRPEEPGTYLYWLNRQVHPKARYVSIIRTGNSLFNSDFIVPVYSQNMNNVVALRGSSVVLRTSGGHMLGYQDAMLLVELMIIGNQI